MPTVGALLAITDTTTALTTSPSICLAASTRPTTLATMHGAEQVYTETGTMEDGILHLNGMTSIFLQLALIEYVTI